MKAYILIDHNAPEECDRSLVFAESPEAAKAHLVSYQHQDLTVERCEKGDQFIPPGLTETLVCDDGQIMLACGITPYGWTECISCGTWGEWDDWEYCDECDAERQQEEE